MPTYQYACTACEHRFEAVQSFTDATLTECPQCQGKLRKLYGSVGVVFKGSGFYRTDSRNGNSGSTAAKTSSSTSSSSDSSSTKSDSGSTSNSTASTSTASATAAAS